VKINLQKILDTINNPESDRLRYPIDLSEPSSVVSGGVRGHSLSVSDELGGKKDSD
jgi:hypothetical protein